MPSAGTVLRALVLEEAVFGAGLEEFDFLDGDEAYKFKWATGVRRLYDVVVYRPSWWGRARCLLGGVGALAKSEVKRWIRRS